MCEHDSQLPGLNKIPIVTAAVKVDNPNIAVINNKEISLDLVKKDDFEETRKLLNSNTLKQNVQKKNPLVAKSLTKRSGHMDIRCTKPS